MPEINDRVHSILYHDEKILGEIDVEIDGRTERRSDAEQMLTIVQRVQDAVAFELQTIQDELDEGSDA